MIPHSFRLSKIELEVAWPDIASMASQHVPGSIRQRAGDLAPTAHLRIDRGCDVSSEVAPPRAVAIVAKDVFETLEPQTCYWIGLRLARRTSSDIQLI